MPARTAARHLTWHLISGFITSSSKSVCDLLYLTQCSTLPLFNPVDIIGPFYFPIPHSFIWRFCLSEGSVNNVSLVLFLPFCCLSMHSTLGVSGTGTRLDLIEWLLLEH
jgi:hypothetical protein